MSSPFGDDAEHPDRPDTLDFWRLSQVTLKLDGAIEAGVSIPDTTTGNVDMASMLYLAKKRCEQFLHELLELNQLTPGNLREILMSTFMTGLMTGIEFQKEGGHRDG